MKEIPLTKGKVALVDDVDYEFLMQRSWHYSGPGYAAARVGDKVVYMHHLLMGKPPRGLIRDHENRNKLDNQRHNLRFVTFQENMLNTNRRKYQGISFDYRHGKFKCYYDKITLGQPKQRVNIGTFRTREEAYEARQNYLNKATIP